MRTRFIVIEEFRVSDITYGSVLLRIVFFVFLGGSEHGGYEAANPKFCHGAKLRTI